jgi:hypothetical protein
MPVSRITRVASITLAIAAAKSLSVIDPGHSEDL